MLVRPVRGELLDRRGRPLARDLLTWSVSAAPREMADRRDFRDMPVVTIDGDSARIDFTGTSPAVAGNVNCPLAVTRSACAFALRVLLPADAAANAGTYAPITVRAPEGCLVNAKRPAAVVAGNVETSQRIADTVLLALAQACPDLPAQGQGTMNNLTFGDDRYQY